MSEHFTLRLPDGATARLARRSRATGLPARTLAARYVEEGLRCDEHPLIHFKDGATGRRAAVRTTLLDVWEVMNSIRDHEGDRAAVAEYLEIRRAFVEAAFVYATEFAEEINAEIAENDAAIAEGLAAYRRAQAAPAA